MIELLLGFFVLGSICLALRETREGAELVPAPQLDETTAAPSDASVYDAGE